MTILIKGIEMPGKCADCQFIDYFKGQWYCHIINDCLETGMSKRDGRCPLIEVPTPHGRLIDADALLAEAKRISGPITGDGWDNYGVYALIERQPTAMEAEE